MGEVESDIVWQLGLIAGPATSVFSTIGVLCYLFYRIDRKRHAAITAALGESRRRCPDQVKAHRPVKAQCVKPSQDADSKEVDHPLMENINVRH